MTEYHFERTPIMPTYLVAFIVGEFDYVEKVNDLGTLVRVYTPVGKAHMGNFTLDVNFLEKFLLFCRLIYLIYRLLSKH